MKAAGRLLPLLSAGVALLGACRNRDHNNFALPWSASASSSSQLNLFPVLITAS
jgi:hypothetical protein